MITRIEAFSHKLPNDISVINVYTFSSTQMSMGNYRYLISHALPGILKARGRAYQGRTLLVQKDIKTNHDWALEIGLLPGIQDNIANTAMQLVMDVMGKNPKIPLNKIQLNIRHKKVFLGKFPLPQSLDQFFNPVINTMKLLVPVPEFFEEEPVNDFVPEKVKTQIFDTNISEDKLLELSRDLSLGMNIDQLLAVKEYFRGKQRPPSDIELQALGQTWSEHCKHTIFSSPIDEISSGLYRHYLKESTYKIMERKKNFCVSVFDDNAGAIQFDKDWVIASKVETHNTPSALEPFSGALTGILGVNRDIIGFGKGAKPIANSYGFCFSPEHNKTLFYAKNRPVLSPRKIASEVIRGVMVGGNCSGIPTAQGFIYVSEHYLAKPLVFVGSLGLLPSTINGIPSHIKHPEEGDLIVIIGSKTGKDGIHGANFSSAAANESIPYTSIQTGDPITQKKLSDVIINNLRATNCYNSITDNGAGGLSSSIGEMGRSGFFVELDRLSTKFEGISPWEMWISESQERMTLSVPEHKLSSLETALKLHDVDFSVIGTFNTTKRAVVTYKNQVIMDIDTDFLHNGCPKPHLYTQAPSTNYIAQDIPNDLDLFLTKDLNSQNHTWVAECYDHEVQGSSLLKPLQGPGRIRGATTAIRPVLSLSKAIAQTQALAIIDDTDSPYEQTRNTIIDAICNLVSTGVDPDKIALIDNFCWSNPYDQKRLWQLKECAKSCHDCAIAFDTPFISGKDSMFNDFRGNDENNNKISISNTPTLLISAIGIIENIDWSISIDVKMSEDLLYMICADEHLIETHKVYHSLIQEQLLASSIYNGNRTMLKYQIAKKLLAGQLGAEVTIPKKLEQAKGFIVSLSPSNLPEFLKRARKVPHYALGIIKKHQTLTFNQLESHSLKELYSKINSILLYQ